MEFLFFLITCGFLLGYVCKNNMLSLSIGLISANITFFIHMQHFMYYKYLCFIIGGIFYMLPGVVLLLVINTNDKNKFRFVYNFFISLGLFFVMLGTLHLDDSSEIVALGIFTFVFYIASNILMNQRKGKKCQK
ncbi:MAG: hypothetical protein ACK5LT_10440 [Lachnospirales bacterium]